MLTQAEYEAVGAHVFNSGATGDIPYGSSATQLSRLAIGANDSLLQVASSLPSWQTLATVMQRLFWTEHWEQFPLLSWPANVVSGSGAVSGANAHRMNVTTGTTATSTAGLRTTAQPGFNHSRAYDVIDWAKPVVMAALFSPVAGTTNGVTRLTIGKTTGVGIANPTTRAIGFRIDNLAVKGLAHNGSALAVVDLSTNVTATNTYSIAIVSDGAGNVTWYWNESSVGTTAAGPSALSSTGECILWLEVDNGGDTANQEISLNSLKLFIGQ